MPWSAQCKHLAFGNVGMWPARKSWNEQVGVACESGRDGKNRKNTTILQHSLRFSGMRRKIRAAVAVLHMVFKVLA